jgi:hypothetical protein
MWIMKGLPGDVRNPVTKTKQSKIPQIHLENPRIPVELSRLRFFQKKSNEYSGKVLAQLQFPLPSLSSTGSPLVYFQFLG